jgi:hypothetical protein
MKSVATRRFWTLYQALPVSVQDLAVKNYRLWRSDPHHPSLRFRRLQGSAGQYTVRIGDHHRALARIQAETVTWVWIGTHAEYDRLIK